MIKINEKFKIRKKLKVKYICCGEAEEMALPEDLTSVPRPQMVAHNCLLFRFQGI